jgi:hypothetical protein
MPAGLQIAALPAWCRADQTITPKMHHLRWGPALSAAQWPEREWDDFPQAAEGSDLVLKFDGKASDAERTLRIRQRDLKRQWVVQVNGKEIAKLPRDENEQMNFYAVPAGLMKDGPNELRVTSGAPPAARPATVPANPPESDDVMIGEIELIDRSRSDVVRAGSLTVWVLDERTNREVPSRITIVDERGVLVGLGNESDDTHAVRAGVVYTADGKADVRLPAGSYVVYAGRGFEYSLAQSRVKIAEGQNKPLKLKISRVVPTDGWVACDTHVHTFTWSRHGDATIRERMVTLAGEGIELPIATDHNLQINYDSEARAAKVRDYFTPVIGNEVTTAAAGHFNVFPIAPDAKLINWRVRDWAGVQKSIREIAGDPDSPDGPVVILNHARDIHGGFRPFDPKRHDAATGRDLEGWPFPANAMEVINSGATQTDPLELFHDWLGMLNGGFKLTPVGSSDSHDVSRYIVGQGRTYIRCKDTDAGGINIAEAVRNFRAGKVTVSYGLFADIKVAEKFGPGDRVTVEPSAESVKVNVRVLGPEWTTATHVALYANGVKIKEVEIAKADGVAAGVKWQGVWTIDKPTKETHLVALATGPGVIAPYWPAARPYQPRSGKFQPTFFACTGAVWIDGKH